MISAHPAISATVVVLILYIIAGVSVKRFWGYKFALNPLKIVAGVSKRASLSNTQVFFFTLIVAWLALFWAAKTGELIPIHETVLGLLGITVIGSGASKAAAVSRFRVTGENWAWSKRKRWIKESFNKSKINQTPKISDLLTSDQGFEIAKFQAVVFSLVIGISLLYNGATAEEAADFSNFKIEDVYLGLIGLSQGVYVSGKVIGPDLFAELNKKLDLVRKREVAFISAVSNSNAWKESSKSDEDKDKGKDKDKDKDKEEERRLKLASEQCAPTEYAAYMSAASEAVEIVGHLTGNPVEASNMEPGLPSIK